MYVSTSFCNLRLTFFLVFWQDTKLPCKMYEVASLVELATNATVRQARLLRSHASIVPPVLYHPLLLASIKANRILSIRSLLLTWPLQELCVEGCMDFRPEHACLVAHCLQDGCPTLRVVDLSWCNTGIQGTKLLLKFALGKVLPKVHEYGIRREEKLKSYQTTCSVDSSTSLQSLKADCYVDQGNFPLFMDVLDHSTIFNFSVSCLHAIELGAKRIKKILKKLVFNQAQFVSGLNFEMNGLPYAEEIGTTGSSYIIPGRQNTSSVYSFPAFNNFSNLKYLNLSGNLTGLFVIYLILMNLPCGVHLTHLLLNSCYIGAEKQYIDEISKLECIQKLEHLELANNRLQHAQQFMKVFFGCSSTLLHLNLELNDFRQDSLPVLKKLLMAPFILKKLCIGDNHIPAHDLKQLQSSSCETKF